jgi:hypothetical protein
VKKNNTLLYISFGLIFILGVLHWAASMFYLYWTHAWFDNFMHFLGGLSLGLLALWVFYASGLFSVSVPSLSQALIASVATVMLIGIGWEVFEYVFDLTQATEELYYMDVIHDLVADALGAMTAAFVAQGERFYINQIEV